MTIDRKGIYRRNQNPWTKQEVTGHKGKAGLGIVAEGRQFLKIIGLKMEQK